MANYSTANIVPGFIEKHEGFSPRRYKDDYAPTVGVIEYSIGYGHQIKPGETFNEPISKEEASRILLNDLKPRIYYLNKVLPSGLSDLQFTALLDNTMSYGAETIPSKNLFKLVNKYVVNKSESNKQELVNWWKTHYVTAGGNLMQSLVERRENEVEAFFLNPIAPGAMPSVTYIAPYILISILVSTLLILILLKLIKP